MVLKPKGAARICVFAFTEWQPADREELIIALDALDDEIAMLAHYAQLEDVKAEFKKADLVIFLDGSATGFKARLAANPGLQETLIEVFLNPAKVVLGAGLGMEVWFEWAFTPIEAPSPLGPNFQFEQLIEVKPEEQFPALPGRVTTGFNDDDRRRALHAAAQKLTAGTIILGVPADTRLVIAGGLIVVEGITPNARLWRYEAGGEGSLGIKAFSAGSKSGSGPLPIEPDRLWPLAA
jgi:hypothetical protein